MRVTPKYIVCILFVLNLIGGTLSFLADYHKSSTHPLSNKVVPTETTSAVRELSGSWQNRFHNESLQNRLLLQMAGHIRIGHSRSANRLTLYMMDREMMGKERQQSITSRGSSRLHLRSTYSPLKRKSVERYDTGRNSLPLKIPFRKLPTRTKRSSNTAMFQATSSEDIKAAAAKKKSRPKKKRRKVTRARISNQNMASGTKSVGSDANVFLSSENQSDIEEDGEVTASTLNHDAITELPIPSTKGVARLSRAVAKAAAKREGNGLSPMNGRRVRRLKQTGKPEFPSINSQSHSQSKYTSDSHSSTPKSLTQLTRVIDSQLYANGPRGTTRGDYPEIDGVIQNARDNMISLLGFNQVKGDWKIHSSVSTFNVAVVFGKELVRDQVTVEYASRIRTLARLFKNEPEFRPSLVCFCGGVAEGSNVANSDAGYIFFRHMCEAQGIDLGDVSVFIDNKSQNDQEAMKAVTDIVKGKYVPQWLEVSPMTTALDTRDMKTIDVHFTLVSTEYHLCNINDVHHRSPGQSLLLGIEYMNGIFHQHKHCISDSQQYQDKLSKKELAQGIVKISWSFQYATYPYIYAKDDSIVFLGKCFLLGEELEPLVVNMKAVVEQTEFFQRDNYLMLASIRRSLVEQIEALHKPSRSRKKTLNTELRRIKDIYGMERDVITILEGALLSLGRCVDLVKPAGLHEGSVSKEDWRKALKALEHSMNEISSFCDPDRPLMPSEWGKLVDGDSPL